MLSRNIRRQFSDPGRINKVPCGQSLRRLASGCKTNFHSKMDGKRICHSLSSHYSEIANIAVQMDEPPAWTLDQIVGLVFGGFLVILYFSSTKIDVYIARSQRKQLGLCEQCGGLYDMESCPNASCPMRKDSSK